MKNCKTCKKNIGTNEPVYTCVACNTHLHLTTACTGLTPVAVNGIKDLGNHAMLLCNGCLEKNARERFIRSYTQSNLVEKLESLDLNDQLLSMENRLTEIVDTKINEALKHTLDKVDKTYSSVLAENLTSVAPKQPQAKVVPEKPGHNINKSFRVQGIPEDLSKSKSENLVPTSETIEEVLNICGVQPRPVIAEMKRLGKFDEKRNKPRTVMVSLNNEHEVRMILATAKTKRKDLADRNIYILPALTPEDAKKENMILKKRRELINSGVPKEKLSIRSLELYNDGDKIDFQSEAADAATD